MKACSGQKNIVELIEFDEYGSELYFVMEYCPSTLLRSVLEENEVGPRCTVVICLGLWWVWSCCRLWNVPNTWVLILATPVPRHSARCPRDAALALRL